MEGWMERREGGRLLQSEGGREGGREGGMGSGRGREGGEGWMDGGWMEGRE